MKYKTIKLTQRKGKWFVNIHTNEQERKMVKTLPSKLGFFHYPETMKDSEALNELKKVIEEELKKDIEHLNKLLTGLKDCELL